MAIQWAVLRDRIARKLNDPSYQKYSQQLLMDAANDALRHFAAHHTGVEREASLTGDGTTDTFPLPTDVVDTYAGGVYAVKWSDGNFIRETTHWPSDSPNPEYILWPRGYIKFTETPSNGATITLYYVGYYTEITDDSTVVEVPNWAIEAIEYRTMAGALDPGIVKRAELGQYQSRREAGGPEDNPLLRAAEYFLKRYDKLLDSFRAPQYDIGPVHGSPRRRQ